MWIWDKLNPDKRHFSSHINVSFWVKRLLVRIWWWTSLLRQGRKWMQKPSLWNLNDTSSTQTIYAKTSLFGQWCFWICHSGTFRDVLGQLEDSLTSLKHWGLVGGDALNLSDHFDTFYTVFSGHFQPFSPIISSLKKMCCERTKGLMDERMDRNTLL